MKTPDGFDDSFQILVAQAIVSGNDPICEVTVEASQTVNTGNYNSLRVAASIKVPCPMGHEKAGFQYAEAWVGEQMASMLAKMGVTQQTGNE